MLTLPLQNHVVPVDQLGAAKVAENLSDFTALAADNGLGLFVVVGGEPATDSTPSPFRITTASPRSKLPSTRVTPAGNRLLPEASAWAAPLSTVTGALRLQRAGDPALARRYRIWRAMNQVPTPCWRAPEAGALPCR